MLGPAAATCTALLLLAGGARSQFGANYTGPPIEYGRHETEDPVARLRAGIERGDVELRHGGPTGYLRAVLAALDVPVSSQGLVFSKTSFQIRFISPDNPRAVYFGDEVYVGYVPGGEVLELTAVDPVRGPVFYTLAQRAGGKPQITRKTSECLTCHGGSRTADWPGNVVRSVFTRPTGDIVTSTSSFLTTHASPIDQRWGGWYVTGTHGAMRHMGNTTLADGTDPKALDREAGANVTDLADRIDTSRYPSPHSDIVALMVLEHQAEMHNLFARATYRVARARYLQAARDRVFGHAAGKDDVVAAVIRDAANQVLEYLLFKREATFDAPVRGTSSFAEEFPRRGPRDARGRSLRELDLQGRLFRYPCSYTIYSPAFDAMPEAVRARIAERMYRILSGSIGRRSWGLSRDQRQAILDILLATKPGLTGSWEPTTVR